MNDLKLEKAKEIIRRHFNSADCGIFDTRNLVCDPMTTVYNENGLRIDICYRYAYFEVFGLTEKEFQELELFYTELERRRK